MNVVSFKTAKRLKEAGFLRPEKLSGQIWYGTRYKGGTESYQLPFLVGEKLQTLRCSDGIWLKLDDHVFAPSATDILKELGYDFALKFFDDSKKFCCWQDNQDGSWETWTDDNPAEACAAAWLSIHEKTTEQ